MPKLLMLSNISTLYSWTNPPIAQSFRTLLVKKYTCHAFQRASHREECACTLTFIVTAVITLLPSYYNSLRIETSNYGVHIMFSDLITNKISIWAALGFIAEVIWITIICSLKYVFVKKIFDYDKNGEQNHRSIVYDKLYS